eukprot:1675278-Prymnesium_polylepis.1
MRHRASAARACPVRSDPSLPRLQLACQVSQDHATIRPYFLAVPRESIHQRHLVEGHAPQQVHAILAMEGLHAFGSVEATERNAKAQLPELPTPRLQPLP